eukprot:491203-Lingulodinium_polyedra.AAC.1
MRSTQASAAGFGSESGPASDSHRSADSGRSGRRGSGWFADFVGGVQQCHHRWMYLHARG